MKNIGAALVTFRTLEIRQDLLPRPALASKRCPVVIVGVMAADIDHAVDRARSAQRPAARLVASASVEPRLRHCLEGPVVDFRLARQHCRHADRRPDDNTPTLAAGLDQADGDLVIFRKASRERRAGRAAACEDIIVCHASPSLVRCYYLRRAQPVANAGEAAAKRNPKTRSASARICIARATRSNGSSTRSSNVGASRRDTTNSPPTISRSSNSLVSEFGCALVSPRFSRPSPVGWHGSPAARRG